MDRERAMEADPETVLHETVLHEKDMAHVRVMAVVQGRVLDMGHVRAKV